MTDQEGEGGEKMVDSVTSGAAIPAFMVGSSADAVDVLDAVQVTLTDTIRHSIQLNVSAASRLLQILGSTTSAAFSLFKGLTGSMVPVTVSSLETTPKTADALTTLFAADGPNLGQTLAESNQTYDLLTSLGITVDAPVQTPVLLEIDNQDGTPPFKAFGWFSTDQMAAVTALTDQRTSPYPGARVFVSTTTNASGKVTQTQTFTAFQDYANRRTTTTLSFTYLTILINVAAIVQAELAQELANASKNSDRLEQQVKDNATALKKESSNVTQVKTARDEQLAEALRQLRVLKAERDLLRTRALGKETDILPNKGEAAGKGLQLGKVVADAVQAIRDGKPWRTQPAAMAPDIDTGVDANAK